MTTEDEELRKIANNIAEVKTLLIERRQIEQDGKAKGNYTKLAPHLTPSNDKYFPKKHTYDKSKDKAIQKIIKEKLKENAKAIEKAVHTHLKKAGIEELSKNYKEFQTDELVTFIEKGREQVLKDRAKAKEIKQEKKEPVKEIEEQKEDRIKDAFYKIKKEYEDYKENKNEIERDRGFSR